MKEKIEKMENWKLKEQIEKLKNWKILAGPAWPSFNFSIFEFAIDKLKIEKLKKPTDIYQNELKSMKT